MGKIAHHRDIDILADLVCRLYEIADSKCPPSIDFFAAGRSWIRRSRQIVALLPNDLLRDVECPRGGLGELSEAPEDDLFRPSVLFRPSDQVFASG
jgi:hypothetical protein